MAVNASEMQTVKTEIVRALELSDEIPMSPGDPSESNATHNFNRRLVLVGQIGRVRGVLLGLTYRLGF